MVIIKIAALWFFRRGFLRWYATPPYCDVLPIEINKKIKHNFIILFFPKIAT